jgi:hypothetical protein
MLLHGVGSATALSPAGFTSAELRYASAVLRASRLAARVPDTMLEVPARPGSHRPDSVWRSPAVGK